MFTLAANDPDGQLFDVRNLSQSDRSQIDELMEALARLRMIEREVAEHARGSMGLGETDMRALHFLMVAAVRKERVNARTLATHLQITTASTTKLLDRLESAGHIERRPHPQDRRSFVITVVDDTRAQAMESMGRHQAARMKAAIALSPAERGIVTDFLMRMAGDMAHSLEEPLPD